ALTASTIEVDSFLVSTAVAIERRMPVTRTASSSVASGWDAAGSASCAYATAGQARTATQARTSRCRLGAVWPEDDGASAKGARDGASMALFPKVDSVVIAVRRWLVNPHRRTRTQCPSLPNL